MPEEKMRTDEAMVIFLIEEMEEVPMPEVVESGAMNGQVVQTRHLTWELGDRRLTTVSQMIKYLWARRRWGGNQNQMSSTSGVAGGGAIILQFEGLRPNNQTIIESGNTQTLNAGNDSGGGGGL